MISCVSTGFIPAAVGSLQIQATKNTEITSPQTNLLGVYAYRGSAVGSTYAFTALTLCPVVAWLDLRTGALVLDTQNPGDVVGWSADAKFHVRAAQVQRDPGLRHRQRPQGETDDLKRFASWYGYKDQNGDCFVANRWMKESMLFSAYKEVMEGPQAAASIKASLVNPADYDKLIEVYAHTPYPKGIFNVVWAEEYNSWMKEKLFAFFLKDLAVKDVIDATNEKITQLNKKYKVA